MATNRVSSSLKVAVIGSGPIGLCTATALRQQGHRVTIFERRPDTEPRGHALMIQPAAVRALGHLKGAHEAFKRVSIESGPLCLWSYKSDKPFMASQPVSRQQDVPVYERRFQTDRPSVQRVFHELAMRNGVDIVFNKTVDKFEDGQDSVRLCTSDGETYTADLVVAADGIKSMTRKQLFPGRDVEPIPLRESIILTSARTADLAKDARLAAWLEPGTKHGVLGPDRFVLSRHIYGDILNVQFADVNHADPRPVDAQWNTPADVDALRARFADFHTITRAYLEHVDHAEQWQMAMGRTLPTWSSESGRIVLVGDAAHAMLPHGAQGLSQGIEDAVSLAHMLGLSTNVPAVTRAWVALRKPRCELFMQQSTENAASWSLPDGPQQEARDEKLSRFRNKPPPDLSIVEMDMHAEQHLPQFLKWVRDYDVVHECEKALLKEV